MWKEAVFVFDANVLLNLYRYSEKTRKEFLSILEKMGDRIWLPHQFALEYQRNRREVIEDQSSSYEVILKKMDSTLKEMESLATNQHSFLKLGRLVKKVTTPIKTIKKEIEVAKEKHPKWDQKDSIREKLDKLFEGKVGNPCKNIKEVQKEGDQRFSNKIPPGYMDMEKDNKDPTGTRKYGDWIGWYQIIEMSKEVKKPVILVLNEKKEDWWLKLKGNIIGPRPELIREMSDNGVSFHMYSMEKFLEFAKPLYKIKQDVVKEIEEVNKKPFDTQMEDSLDIGTTQGTESGSGIISINDDAGEQTIS